MIHLKGLFKIDWLKEWRRMMCKKMRDREAEPCIIPVEDFPCRACMYYQGG